MEWQWSSLSSEADFIVDNLIRINRQKENNEKVRQKRERNIVSTLGKVLLLLTDSPSKNSHRSQCSAIPGER